MAGETGDSRVLIAPGEFVVMQKGSVAESSEAVASDLGLYEITEIPADRWKYRTPGLRNISLSAPYMHDGSISSLRQVIDFYNDGGIENELLDPLIGPLGLDETEIGQILSFLESLTGDNVDRLVSDAFAVPIGNTDSP